MEIPSSMLSRHLEQTGSIVKIDMGNDSIWLKKASKPHSRFRYTVLGALSTALDLEVLSPIPNPGGTASLYNEVVKINHLHKLGFKVPKIIEIGNNFLLLEDIGKDLCFVLSAEQHRDLRHHITENVFLELLRLHRNGLCLSQAFGRNIIISNNMNVGFIDFEDVPEAHLTKTKTQARDVLLLLFSICHYFRKSDEVFHEIVARFIGDSSTSVRAEIHHTIERLAWILKVPAFINPGADYHRLRQMLSVLS